MASFPTSTWSRARSSTPPKIAPRGYSCSGRGGCASTRPPKGGRSSPWPRSRAGRSSGRWLMTAQQMQGAYAQAMEASEISIMRREDLERLMMEKPEVGLQISHLLSERLRRYETRLEDITLKGITARLASLLVLLLENEGVVTGDHSLKIPTHYTHQQLGTMIGANQTALLGRVQASRAQREQGPKKGLLGVLLLLVLLLFVRPRGA